MRCLALAGTSLRGLISPIRSTNRSRAAGGEVSRLTVVLLLASAALPGTSSDAAHTSLPSPSQEPDWHQALESETPIGFFIAAGNEEDPGVEAGDSQLAAWALGAWEAAAEGRFELVPAAREHSLIHLYWVSGQENLYGEMRPFMLGDKRGAAVFVVPDTSGLGSEIHRRARRDPLFRDTVIYLTCLHELGHALGLVHTADYADIMYSFQHGGDIAGYFQRYRDQVHTRDDIAQVAGISAQDAARLRALYEQSQ